MDSIPEKSRLFREQLILTEKIILIIVAICAILGNTFVLVATWRERSLHQPNKYFIACLAVADLVVGIFVAPMTANELNFVHESRDAKPTHTCRFMVWLDTFALTASFYILTVISFDRYLKISKPLHYRSRMTTFKLLKIISCIVLISSVYASYNASSHSGSWGILDTGTGFCSDAAKIDKVGKGFFTFFIIMAFFLPTIFTLAMYVRIFFIARKRQKMFRSGQLRQNSNNKNRENAFLQNMKVIRMQWAVMGVFILCWSPGFIWMLVSLYYPHLIDYDNNLQKENIDIFHVISNTLPIFNSLCNPVIYAWLDQTYRKAFKHLFKKIMCRPDARRHPPIVPIELRS
ncbi:beta-1 adrenergic receptor-like [Dendronephthya gigantea]|uniref:beta-1 adrenergic receptor-like n=1 Tax=Dendronephthya gigantea TaxID=151771 RepID=UPI00106D0984|nr:beta-1 adrenergic receptor-like [Dendronephthya gigantea]